jgi:hypothetical protein
MPTSNLDLELVDLSDYVSPTPFNENFKKIDKLAADYIMESGKSGEYWYRKYKSGRMECGVDAKKFGTTDMVRMADSSNRSGYYRFPAFPFAFKSQPLVFIAFLKDDNGAGECSIDYNNSTTLTQPTTFAVVNWPVKALPYKMTPTCGLYAMGYYA